MLKELIPYFTLASYYPHALTHTHTHTYIHTHTHTHTYTHTHTHIHTHIHTHTISLCLLSPLSLSLLSTSLSFHLFQLGHFVGIRLPAGVGNKLFFFKSAQIVFILIFFRLVIVFFIYNTSVGEEGRKRNN